MNATITYTLSPEGQRAALASGQSGEARRTDTIEIAQSDIPLFDVDSKGALTANLGESGLRSFGTYWKSHQFDAPLTAQDALAFLQERTTLRSEVLAAEKIATDAKAVVESAAEAAQRLADLETLRMAAEGELGGVKTVGREVWVGNYPNSRSYTAGDADAGASVATILEKFAAKQEAAKQEAEAEAARKKLLESIPAAPTIRPATLQSDGRLAFTVPDPGHDAWSKLVSAVDAAGQNGSAFDGAWLKCGHQTVAAAGDMIVVGSKWWEGSRRNGEYKKTRDVYIVTTAGLMAVKNAPSDAAETLAQTPAERVEVAIEARLTLCAQRIAKIDGLDRAALSEVVAHIDSIRTEWTALQTALQTALETARKPAPITTVAEAAEAILAAGYKALAVVNHPDKGGSSQVMGLLTDARNQMRELLALAAEVAA